MTTSDNSLAQVLVSERKLLTTSAFVQRKEGFRPTSGLRNSLSTSASAKRREGCLRRSIRQLVTLVDADHFGVGQ